MYDWGVPEIAEQHTPPMKKPLNPADLLIDYTESEVTEACNGFIQACMEYRNSLREENQADWQDNDLRIWMHPDMFTWVHYVLAMGISDQENMWFFGLRLEMPFLEGKGSLYQFHKP